MGSQKRILLAVFVALIIAISATTSLNAFGRQTNAPTQPAKPTASHVIDPSSSVIPNGDFEDTRILGTGAGSYPVGGWTGGARNSSDDIPAFSSDAYLHSWSWQQSLNGTSNSWKWIGYDFNAGNVPDFIAFALKEVSGASGRNLVSVLFEDHSQSPPRRMCYEFSTNLTQMRPDGWDGYAYSYTYHEKIDLNTWCYRIKNWKADWQNKLGYAPGMSHWWRIVFAVDSFAVASPIIARYDAIWLGNLPSSNILQNGDFEDPAVNNPGLYAFPNGWTTENHGGYTGGSFYSGNTNTDSYSGSRCWEMYINADNGWKNIWYYLPGSGAPDLCAFAVKIAEGNNSHDIVQVKIKDLTKSIGVNVELIYEFSNDSQQVMPSNTYQKVIHEPVDYGAWYYRIKDWKTDWYNKYNGSQPDMNDHWAVLLGTNTYEVYDTMVARFDAISMSWVQVGSVGSVSTLLIFSVVSMALIVIGLFAVRIRRSRSEETTQASLNEENIRGQVDSEKRETRSIGKCIVCNLNVYDGEDVRWCRFCGSLAHRAHLLEWVHVKGSCPICKNRLEAEDLK